MIEYLRNSAFALGIIIVMIKKRIPKKEEFNNLFSSSTKT